MKNQILVCGLGISGEGAALLALKLGKKVIVADENDTPSLQEKGKKLAAMGAKILLGWKENTPLPECETIILSPGLKKESKLYRALPENTEKISELFFALRHIPCPFAAVTGTNGKTTVTELTTALLLAAGKKAVSSGNVGNSLSSCVAMAMEGIYDLLMIEVSSFQLESMPCFPPCPAALMNIGSDHIDRHGSLEEYARIKFLLLKEDRQKDWRILHTSTVPFMQKFLPEKEFVTFSSQEKNSLFYADTETKYILYKNEKYFDFSTAKLKGRHNMENMCASLALLRGILGEESLFLPAVKKALQDFASSPCRMEVFLEKGAVRYVDDSKATNPHAVNASVKTFAEESGKKRKIILLLGGLDKGMDFSELEESLPYVKKIFLMGQCAGEIEKTLAGKAEMEKSGSFAEAVEKACAFAKAGDVVLLSPATASMDMFKNYLERGNTFKKLVRKYWGEPV